MKTRTSTNITGKVKKNPCRETPSKRKARIASNNYKFNELGN